MGVYTFLQVACLLPRRLTSICGVFLGVLVTGIRMLASDVMSCMSLVFSCIIWLCNYIACCLMTGRRPDRTSWVAPGLRVVHGHGGGLTTIDAGAGTGVGIGDSPWLHILCMNEGFSLPPLTIRFIVRLAFHDLYCKYMPRIAIPIMEYRMMFEPLDVPASAERLNRP